MMLLPKQFIFKTSKIPVDIVLWIIYIEYITNQHRNMEMKITQSDYEDLKQAIETAVKKYPDALAFYRQRTLNDERYRWDMLHVSGFNTSRLYEYLDDSHIDTALRKITSTGK